MGQTNKIPDDDDGRDFRALAKKIDQILNPLGFPIVGYKGSYSWTGNKNTKWINETIWKLCYWSRTSWSFGVRKDFVDDAGKMPQALPLCPDQFNVSPKVEVQFIGFNVKNDVASFAKITQLIATVTT